MEGKRVKSGSKLSIVTIVLFAIAAALLLFSGVGSARAALLTSSTLDARMIVSDIGTAITENGTDCNGSELLLNLLGDDEEIVIGKVYDEKLSVHNTGSIDTYVRLEVTTRWLDKDGNVMTELSPDLIHLGFNEGSGWVEDTSAATTERRVFYYTSPIAPGAYTADLTSTLQIDPYLATVYTDTTTENEDGTTTVTRTYAYNDCSFQLLATCDAVQTHNAADAITSAWGIDSSLVLG